MKSIVTPFNQTMLALAMPALLCCAAHTAFAASIDTPTYTTYANDGLTTNDLTNLGQNGALDWQIYGGMGGSPVVGLNPVLVIRNKASGGSITNLGMYYTGTAVVSESTANRSSAKFAWSDGAASGTSDTGFNPSESWNSFKSTAATVAYGDYYETFRFVPGDTNPHTIYVLGYYVNNQHFTLQFETSLPGVASPPTLNPTPSQNNFIYSVTFQADNPTDALEVKFTFNKTSAAGTLCNVGINAVAIEKYAPPFVTWTGATDNNWDTLTANWSSGTYADGATGVQFDDTASRFNVNVSATVNPLGINVINSVNDYAIGGSPIAGSGLLTKTGSSVLTLAGANTFSGGVELKAGTLRLGASESIPDGAGKGGLTMSTNSTLDLNGRNETLNSLSGDGTIDNVAGGGSSTLVVGNNNASSAFSGVIQNSSGTVGLVKTGTNSLTLSGTNNTFGGGVTLNAGQLNLNNSGALGSGPLTIGDSGVALGNTSGAAVTLATTNAQNWNGDFSFVGNNLNFGPGPVTMSGSRTVTVSANNLTVGGQIAGSGYGLTKSGGGQLQINSSNTFNGPLVVNAGTIQLSSAHLGGGPVTLTDSANLQVNSSPLGATLNVSALTFGTNAGNTNILTFTYGTNDNPGTALITAGALTTSNIVTVNINGSGLSEGQFPLISYSGSLGGSGFAAFQLGTLPYPTFVATLVDNSANHSVDINIMEAGGPPKIWVGGVNGNWDIDTTTNWLDSVFLVPATYTETTTSGDTVRFDDTASNATVNVVAPVKPASITVNSSNLNYTIGGAAIAKGSFTKQGAASLTLTANNTFTNNASLQGGMVYLGANGALGAGQVSLSGSTVSSDGATARSVTNVLLVTADSTFGDGGAGSGSLTFSGPVNWGGGSRSLTANTDVLLSGGSTNGLMSKAGFNTITLQGVHDVAGSFFNVANGTLRLDGAWMTNNSTNLRLAINQTNGTARLTINGGGFVCANSGTVFRLGFNAFGNSTAGGLSSGATNILDVNGLLELTGTGGIIMGRSAAWSELNLLANGDLRVNYIRISDIAGNRCPTQVNFNGGTLRATTNSTTFVSGLDNVYILNGGVTIDSAGFDLTIPQALLQGQPSSTGGLTKIGTGTLTLSGANSYTGTTTVNQGELVMPTTATIAGAILVTDGGSLHVDVAAQSPTLFVSALTLGTTASHNGSLDIALGGVIPTTAPLTITGTLSASGTNTVNVTGTNLFMGQFPLIQYFGTLSAGTFSSFRLGSLPDGIAGTLVNNTANSTIDLNITKGPLRPLQWSGLTDDKWDINATGNWFDSLFSLPAVYVESAGIGPAVTFNDSASLFTVNVTASVSPASMTVDTTGEYTIGGVYPIGGAGTLTKSSLGGLTLTSPNTYSGGTTVTAGTLRLGANGALGSGLLTLSGGTLSSDGPLARTNILAGVRFTIATILGDSVNNGLLNLDGTVDWNNGRRSLTIASDVVLSGGSTNGSFNKAGAGVLTLKGSHAFTRLSDVYQGDVVFDGASAIVSNAAPIQPNCNVVSGLARIVLTNGTTYAGLDASSPNVRVGASGEVTATNVLDLAGTMTAAPGGVALLGTSCALGEVNLLSGGALEVAQVRSGDDPNFNGESRLNFNGGILRATTNSANFLVGLSNVLVLNGGAILDSSHYNLTVLQPLLRGGTGGLTKTGNGVLTLNSINTFTNTTLVSAGILAGTGTVAGPLSVGTNGTLAPGDNGIGTFTIQGPLTLATGSITRMEINASSHTSDVVTGLTTATYGGTLVVSNLAMGTTPPLGQSFQLFSPVAAPVGNFSSITPAPGTGLGWSFNPTNGVLTAVTATQKSPPVFTGVAIAGGNLVVSGTNGAPGGTYVILSSTNVALPLASWLPEATNNFDGNGAFTALIPVTNTVPAKSFLLQQ